MAKMLKVLIVYYSQTGNTEKMARAVEEGAKSVVGINVEVKYFARPEELAEADAIILGMPTYYHDMGIDMKNLLEAVSKEEIDLKGKVGAAFGSYGWSGEAPIMLVEIMKHKFGMDVIEPPIRIKYNPDGEGLDECRKLGKTVAEKIVKSALDSSG
ncbi:MAG: flavodoxin domain-containing protein [Candidatus Bathyarchaeum sp.]|nr:MAG: flavodoxin domain-containing protein [Candidatus Bathyarchaeum sp.]